MEENALVELIRGKGAFIDALTCVSELTARAAGERAGAPYSVYELVFHMNYWMDYELQRLGGQRPAYPEHAAEGWPREPVPASEDEWQAVEARFSSLLGRMSELARDEAAGARPVPITSQASHANQGTTLREVLWQTVVHNAYHLGQVAMVRRMLGAWPPPRGGDTW